MDLILFVHILATLFSFFVAGALIGALFSASWRARLERVYRKSLELLRASENPLIRPGTHPWTAEAVLNPAAIALGGRTHLIYRAVGMDGASRLGYASSADGIVFDRRLPAPVYVAQSARGGRAAGPPEVRAYSPVLYPSGGSWGGCEDPRMLVLAGRVYVTFNMFDNWKLRVAVISMSEEDFLAGRFYKWEGPVVLSHGDRDKNWVLFPEKINGKFAVLHSLFGETSDRVRVEYTDDLATLVEREFASPDPQQMPDEQIAWHYRMRSAGPPPLKTAHGWLVLYHAMDPKEPSRYKLGAMLLNRADPTKVLRRSSAPILSPDEHYENHGKPGVVYACGAVVRDGTLYVYYGGADKVVCVASTPLDAFLRALVEGSQTSLTTVPAQTA